MRRRLNQQILRVSIALLALADGVLHLFLNLGLFRGGPPPGASAGGFRGGVPGGVPGGGGPPPGAGRFPFILPLNQLFLLNFIGWVILVILFWFSPRLLGKRRWLMDVAMIVYAAVAFVAWLLFGAPNPMGLGYVSKGIEIALVIALSVDIWDIRRQSRRQNLLAEPVSNIT